MRAGARRINSAALRGGGYEVQVAFGPFRAHECAVEAEAGRAPVAVGAVTDFTVGSADAEETSRVFVGTEVVQAHVTGVPLARPPPPHAGCMRFFYAYRACVTGDIVLASWVHGAHCGLVLTELRMHLQVPKSVS